jgi:ElaB/YqjD/DUF883 family membrane-anchored ribosome-binding protein
MAIARERSDEPRKPFYGSIAPETKQDGTMGRDNASLASTVSGTVDEVQKSAAKNLSSLEAAIRQNPTRSAMIAAGAGFLFGLVLSR